MKKNYNDKTILLDDILDDRKFIIPTFQRNVVWKKKRRTDFLRNIREGDPFGIILIRENDGKYELIDGLQRISTIRDYLKNPFDYLEPNDVNIEVIEKIVKAKLQSEGLPIDQEYIDRVKGDYRNKMFECIKGGLENYEVMTAFRKEFDSKDEKSINTVINNAYKNFKDSTEITGLTVQAINYVGPEENIPTVFYNLNTGGIQLSKYETYAALWSSSKFVVKDNDIIDAIKNKYAAMEADSDLDVDFDEDSLLKDGITLFEYCYSLSSILRNISDGTKAMFGKNDKSTDPIGFEIVALLLTGKVNKADKIYELLKDVSKDFLVSLKNAIKQSVKHLADVLNDLVYGKNGTYLYSDNIYLAYHMLISYIKEYYTINVEQQIVKKSTSSLPQKDFDKYAPLHYLYDCMIDFWKYHRQVSDLQKELASEAGRHKYWYNIKLDDWNTAVQQFMDSQSGVTKTIPHKNKLFIDFITKQNIKANPQYNQFFTPSGMGNGTYSLDFEHIVPQKRIERHIQDLPVGLQRTFYVSDVGNLCYLTGKDNRAKKDKTLYEFAEDRPAYIIDKEFRECVYYPDSEDLFFLDYPNEDFRDNYDEFLQNRHNQLSNAFLGFIKNF